MLFWIDAQLVFEESSTTDYICTYRFTPGGRLIGHRIERIGVRGSYPRSRDGDAVAEHVARLGRHQLGDIVIHPFQIEFDGHIFGCVARTDDAQAGDEPMIDVMPGMTLMFYPPWEEGGYDT